MKFILFSKVFHFSKKQYALWRQENILPTWNEQVCFKKGKYKQIGLTHKTNVTLPVADESILHFLCKKKIY